MRKFLLVLIGLCFMATGSKLCRAATPEQAWDETGVFMYGSLNPESPEGSWTGQYFDALNRVEPEYKQRLSKLDFAFVGDPSDPSARPFNSVYFWLMENDHRDLLIEFLTTMCGFSPDHKAGRPNIKEQRRQLEAWLGKKGFPTIDEISSNMAPRYDQWLQIWRDNYGRANKLMEKLIVNNPQNSADLKKFIQSQPSVFIQTLFMPFMIERDDNDRWTLLSGVILPEKSWKKFRE